MRHTYAGPSRRSQTTAGDQRQQAAGRFAARTHLMRSLGNRFLTVSDTEAQVSAVWRRAFQGTGSRRQEPRQRPSDTGEPLDGSPRRQLEEFFGTDLGGIRLHAGPHADAQARRLGASAFTEGQNISFRADTFAPETGEGLRLLAHEVAHTVQQSGRPAAQDGCAASVPRDGRPVSAPDAPEEREAELAADRLVRGMPPPATMRGSGHTPTTAVILRSPATDNISRRTSWYGDLDERTLGRDLLARARAGDFSFVQETFDALGSSDRDDVAYEFCVAATAGDIHGMAATDAGRAVIDRLFDELTIGSMSAEEQGEADRLLRVKTARISLEDFAAGMRAAKIFPFRLPGFTVYDSAPITAERRAGGRIRVHLPTRVLGTAMFRAETSTLPAETFIGGIELPENEIVGIRMYDLGGVLVYRPALILVQLSNETSTTVLSKLVEAVGIGLTLGAGSVVGLGVEATMAARVLLWADRAAFVLGTLASVVKEHRGEILARYGDTGRTFLQYVDYVQSATAVYGFARVALSLGQLVNGLRTAYGNWRAAAQAGKDGAASGVAGELSRNTDELLRHADDIQNARVGMPAPKEAPPLEAPTGPPGFDVKGRITRRGTEARKVYGQGEGTVTCGPVACGMAVDTMGQPHDLSKMIQVAGPFNTPMRDLLALIRRHKIKADLTTGQTIDDLARATSSQAGGNPAVVMIRNLGAKPPDPPFHAVVVDGVTTRMGQRVVAVRDPAIAGSQYFELVDTFAPKFTGEVIVIHVAY